MKSSFVWPLPPGDGPKTVYVQLRDDAGLVTTVDATVILDTTPPEGTVRLRGVGAYALASPVELMLDLNDASGLDAMMVSADAGFADAVWTPYRTSLPWDLGAEEGEVTVHVRVRDGAGNVLTTSTSTVLDLADPELDAVVPGHMIIRTFEVAFSASDGLGLDRATFEWEGYGPAIEPAQLGGEARVDDRTVELRIPEALAPGDEETYGLTLVVRVRDLAGRKTEASLSLTYVPEAPRGALVINGGAEWTNASVVSLAITHTGGLTPTHYRLATTGDGLETAGWAEWGVEATIDLGTFGGQRPVWAQLKGRFDIRSSPFEDRVGVDLHAPAVVIVSPTRESTEEGKAALLVEVTDDQDDAPAVEYRLNGGE